MIATHFQRVSRALADPQRFAILERIAVGPGEVPCRALVEELPISQATISHHLKELTEVGLIGCRREAQCLYLTPRPEAIDAYRRELGRRLGLGS